MNKKILLSAIGLSVGTILLSSYHDGPAHHGAGNRTGSPGTTGCQTCHGGNDALMLDISISDDNNNNAIVTGSSYTPGHTYTVTLKGDLPPGDTSHTKFGFQASVVDGPADIGTLGVAMANTGTYSTTNAGNITVIEHTAPLAKSGNSYIATFKWTAPLGGLGIATFYANMVASNENGIPTGDAVGANMVSLTLPFPTATGDVRNSKKSDLFSIYPNPAKNDINLTLRQLKAGKYDVTITSLDGKVVMHTKTNAVAGDFKIDIASLAKGSYTLTLRSENGYQTTRFVKQ